jgi:hypothetical protein
VTFPKEGILTSLLAEVQQIRQLTEENEQLKAELAKR